MEIGAAADREEAILCLPQLKLSDRDLGALLIYYRDKYYQGKIVNMISQIWDKLQSGRMIDDDSVKICEELMDLLYENQDHTPDELMAGYHLCLVLGSGKKSAGYLKKWADAIKEKPLQSSEEAKDVLLARGYKPGEVDLALGLKGKIYVTRLKEELVNLLTITKPPEETQERIEELKNELINLKGEKYVKELVGGCRSDLVNA